MKRLMCPLFVAALAAGASAADPVPATTEKGDSWEVTTQMAMEGMPPGMIPAQTRTVCSAREWNKPPVPADDKYKCDTTDWRNTPSKSSWKIKCAGPPAMSGEGEINRSSPDAYTGWMKMVSTEGTMTMNLTGRKIGECDVAAERGKRDAQMAAIEKQMADAQKQGDDARRQTCQTFVDGYDLRSLKAMGPTLCPAGMDTKALLCAKLPSDEAYYKTCPREKSDPEQSFTALASYCAVDPEPIKQHACAEAAKKENADMDLLLECCPVEAKAAAEKWCAGRTYSELMGSKYQSFCATYAADAKKGDAKEQPAESGTTKAKKKLKSLFGK